jgi:transcription antitermination factor NusG
LSSPPARILTPGAAVAITGGPFAGLNGAYAGMSARERELVLLNILGATRPVEIAAGSVIARS